MKKETIGLDIGGHRGKSIPKLIDAGCTQIYCFEPSKEFYNICESVAKQHSSDTVSVEVINKALYDDGDYELTVLDDESTLFPEILKYSSQVPLLINGDLPNEKVKGISLKKFIEEKKLTHIHIIKMNCEGSEFKILEDLIDSGVSFDEMAVQFHHEEEKRNSLIERFIELDYNVWGHKKNSVSPFQWWSILPKEKEEPLWLNVDWIHTQMGKS